jgi:hypothetical protein
MVARRSEMSAEWKVRYAISIASVAIQAFTKLLFCFSDVLKATNCTFQEVNNIFRLAVGIAVYDEFFSCMCAAECLCALDVFVRHTSSRITFVALTIVGRSRVDVSSHQDIFQTFRFPESQDSLFFEDVAQLWVFCMVVQCFRAMLDKLLSARWYVMTNGTLFFVFFSVNTTCFAKTMVNARIVVAPLFQMIFQFPKPFFVVCSLEQMRLMRRTWLYGIPLVQCLG